MRKENAEKEKQQKEAARALEQIEAVSVSKNIYTISSPLVLESSLGL